MAVRPVATSTTTYKKLSLVQTLGDTSTTSEKFAVKELNAAGDTPPPLQASRESSLRVFAEVLVDMSVSRDLIAQLTLRDIRIKYKQAVMGFAWAIFMPILVVMAGLLVRYLMANASGADLDGKVVGNMALKALCWAFFSGAIGLATASLIANMNLLSKIYFPREVLPLSTTLAQSVDTLIGSAALAILLPFTGATLSWNLLWIPVLFVLLFLMTLGVAVFLSCANLFFRDVKYIVQVLLTFGIFGTPVLFEPEMLGPVYGKWMMFNPLSPIMEGLRLSVMDGHNLFQPLVVTLKNGALFTAWSPWYLVYAVGITVVGLFFSTVMFRRAAFVFAEYV